MSSVSTFTTIALAIGLFLIFQISPMAIWKGFDRVNFQRRPKTTMKILVDETRGTRKYNPVTKQFVELRELLIGCGREEKYNRYVRLSLLGGLGGAAIAALLHNLMIMPVLALIGAMCPIWYLRFWAIGYKKATNAELETALSIITSSYTRTNNLTAAIEENLQHISPPVREVFEQYIIQTRFIDGSTVKAIRTIRPMIKNPIFAEWCDSLVLCQSNYELKDVLPAVVSKLSDTRSIQQELDTMCYNAIKETSMLIVLTIANIPLMYFLNREWFQNLMFTFPGHIILVLTGFCVIFAVFRAIRVTRPIEYRR